MHLIIVFFYNVWCLLCRYWLVSSWVSSTCCIEAWFTGRAAPPLRHMEGWGGGLGRGEIKGGVFYLRVQFTGIWGQSGLDCCETWKTVKCKIVFFAIALDLLRSNWEPTLLWRSLTLMESLHLMKDEKLSCMESLIHKGCVTQSLMHEWQFPDRLIWRSFSKPADRRQAPIFNGSWIEMWSKAAAAVGVIDSLGSKCRESILLRGPRDCLVWAPSLLSFQCSVSVIRRISLCRRTLGSQVSRNL